MNMNYMILESKVVIFSPSVGSLCNLFLHIVFFFINDTFDVCIFFFQILHLKERGIGIQNLDLTFHPNYYLIFFFG